MEQIVRRHGIADEVLREPHLERPLETQQQFGPAEAVETDITIEFAVEANGKARAPVGLELAGKITDDGEEARCDFPL